MTETAFTEMVEVPDEGRVYSQRRRPLLSDCGPSGRIRLDALARWLQDVAYLDVDDAGVAHLAVWVVRRLRMSVLRFPHFGERLVLETFCSGIGRAWAERRTRISSAGPAPEPVVETVALWVHLDPESRIPTGLDALEIEAYGATGADRRVSARLRHAPPPSLAPASPWRFRATDCDLAGHVNNSAYWLPIEEELLARPDPARLDAEIEFRTPAQPGEMAVLSHGRSRWIVNGRGETHASVVLAPR